MSEEQTDSALEIALICTLSSFAVCFIGAMYRQCTRKPGMKQSRSDNDLTSILDNAIPSSSAYRADSEPV